MSEMANKMFGKSPKLGRNEESGEVEVKKAEKEKAPEGKEANGGGEGISVFVKHASERAELHHKHEHQHHMHDLGKESHDKKELHKKHEEEFAMMHRRHEKELGKEEK